MHYSKGEVTGIAAISLAIATLGVGMNYADRSPHQGAPAETGESLATPGTISSAVAQGTMGAGADFARPKAAAIKPGAGAVQPFVIRHVLPIKDPIAYGKWFWDERGAPAGPIVVTVDLQARVISVFRSGYEIGTSAVLLGSQEKPTPLGVFPITQKDAHHVSNLYDAPMPYMQRLTNDGITLHATNVANGFASHGCIGLPLGFAKQLFSATHLGDRVYITRGKQVGVGADLTSS